MGEFDANEVFIIVNNIRFSCKSMLKYHIFPINLQEELQTKTKRGKNRENNEVKK